MSSKQDTLLHILGFYSATFILVSIYYHYFGKSGETPFLPFVEGASLMFTLSLYMFFWLVTGIVRGRLLRYSLISYIIGLVLVTLLIPDLTLTIGGLIFGLPAIPLGFVTMGNFTSVETFLLNVVAALAIVFSFLRWKKAHTNE